MTIDVPHDIYTNEEELKNNVNQDSFDSEK